MNNFTHRLLPANNLHGATAFSLLLLTLFSFITLVSKGQSPVSTISKKSFRNIQDTDDDLFGTRTRFIKNIGQYGDTIKTFSRMGKILFGYEGLDMPVLF